MSLKHRIKEILREERKRPQQTMMDLINSSGIISAIQVFGDYETIKNVMGGYDFLTKDIMIKTINDVVSQNLDHLTLLDMGINPIITNEEDGELCQLELLTPGQAFVFCYGGKDYNMELDDFGVDYYDLSGDDLREIFEGVVEYHIWKTKESN